MDSPNYPRYAVEKLWAVVPISAIVARHLESYKEFPQRQHPAGFNAADAAQKALSAMNNSGAAQ
jgi:hypothetical protein